MDFLDRKFGGNLRQLEKASGVSRQTWMNLRDRDNDSISYKTELALCQVAGIELRDLADITFPRSLIREDATQYHDRYEQIIEQLRDINSPDLFATISHLVKNEYITVKIDRSRDAGAEYPTVCGLCENFEIIDNGKGWNCKQGFTGPSGPKACASITPII